MFYGTDVYGPYPILELGAATGALSIYLSAAPFLFNICTRYGINAFCCQLEIEPQNQWQPSDLQ